jgi:hypothetical protein
VELLDEAPPLFGLAVKAEWTVDPPPARLPEDVPVSALASVLKLLLMVCAPRLKKSFTWAMAPVAGVDPDAGLPTRLTRPG